MEIPEIRGFYGPYSYLSPMYQHPFYIDGAIAGRPNMEITVSSVEAAYQAHKFTDLDMVKSIIYCVDPMEARFKSLQLREHIRDDWPQLRVPIRLGLTRDKFRIPKLRRLLVGTGAARLVYLSSSPDLFWGMSREGHGFNVYGLMLEHVRNEINHKAISLPFDVDSILTTHELR